MCKLGCLAPNGVAVGVESLVMTPKKEHDGAGGHAEAFSWHCWWSQVRRGGCWGDNATHGWQRTNVTHGELGFASPLGMVPGSSFWFWGAGGAQKPPSASTLRWQSPVASSTAGARQQCSTPSASHSPRA